MTLPLLASAADQTVLRRAQDEISDVFGTIAEFWGFTRTQGRVLGLLFTSPHPLSHGEIRDRLGISAGSASMTLASLVHWGAVHRHGRHFVAEGDLWKLITAVLRRRERQQVESAIERVASVVALLRASEADDPYATFIADRIRRLYEFFRLGRAFLDAFVERGPVHGLIDTIAKRAAKFPLPRWHDNDRVGFRAP